MARPKKASDEAYNARRRARRVIANLEKKKAGMNAKERKATDLYIRQLQKQIDRSLLKNAPKGESKTEAAQRQAKSVSRLQEVGSVKRTSKQERANQIYRMNMNLASGGDTKTALGRYGQERVKIFYKATQRYWQGKPLAQRNELIMQGLGVSSLEEAVRMALSINKDAYKRAIKGSIALDRAGMDEQALSFYEGYEDESDRIDSPPYLAYVVSF